MKYTQKIQKVENIIVHPNELVNIKGYIRSKLQSYISTCTEKNGYIVDICDIDWETMTNKISRISGNCLFSVSYTVENLKPEYGHVYNALVNKMYPDGIFLEYNNITIVIPRDNLSEWTYENNIFIKKDQANIVQISIGDWLSVHIDASRYEDGGYQCIASIIN